MLRFIKNNIIEIILAILAIFLFVYNYSNDKGLTASRSTPIETVVISYANETIPTRSIELTEPIISTEVYTIETTTSTTTEETTTAATTETTEAINEEDIELLAHLIFAEAGSDWIEDETLYYVGSVVLNRVNSDLFPDTIYEVIYQRGQYACTWDGNINKTPTERCYVIAEDLLRNGSVLPEEVVFQAEFTQGSGVYAYQDNLYFCYY